MKTLSLFALLFCTMAATAQTSEKREVTIIGKVSGDTKGYDNIYYYTGHSKLDSVAIHDGRFTITIPFSDIFTEVLFTDYERKSASRGYRPFPLFIDRPGAIYIDMDITTGFYKAEISGLRSAVLYNSFRAQQDEALRKAQEEINKSNGGTARAGGSAPAGGVAPAGGSAPVGGAAPAGRAAPAGGAARTGGVAPAMMMHSADSIMKACVPPLALDFVKANPDEPTAAFVLGNAKYYMSSEQIEAAFRQLSPVIQRSEEGKKITSYINGLRAAVVGNEVKDFVLDDNYGRPFDFAKLKGKYVWIDFWASWCGPCKKAFPKMRELYAKYKGEKFEILGISTDATKEPWIKAVDQFKNPWPQVWDNKTVAGEFAVTAFPTGFLIGPDGRIILREVGFEPDSSEIEKKLQEIFSSPASSFSGPYTLDIDLVSLQEKPGKLYLRYMDRGSNQVITDTAAVRDGPVSFKGDLKEPVMASLVYMPLGNRLMGIRKNNLNFYLGPGAVKIVVKDSLSDAVVTGSKFEGDYLKMMKMREGYDQRLQDLEHEYVAANAREDTAAAKGVLEKMDVVRNEIREKVYKPLVIEYAATSPVTLDILEMYAGFNMKADEVEPLFAKIAPVYRDLPHGKSLQEKIDIARKTDLGAAAIDFTQNDTLGHPVSLSSFRGNYVLLDFWPRWCGPCRAENPNVVKAYKHYHDKGFVILSVSLDQPGQKDKWLKAIYDDGLTWTHVSDLQFWNNAVVKLYGITAVPQNFLIDPQGKIIARNLRGTQLDEKLAMIYGALSRN